MKFSGKNFQPWPDFEIDLSGLTVIFGPSDKGKSSLFRALQGIVRNDIPTESVRWDQPDKLELNFTTDDGKLITATRSANGSTKYTVTPGTDGKPKDEYTSLGKKLPEPLVKLNMGLVQLGEFKLDPIFAPQFGSQFILQGSGPTELNTIIGAFASTEKLEAGKKLANLYIQQKNSEAKTLAKEIGDAEERRERLSQLSQGMNLVRDELHRLEPLIRALEAAGFWLGKAIQSNNKIVRLRELEASLTIPDTLEAERLEQTVQRLFLAAAAQRRIEFLNSVSTVIEPLTLSWNEVVGLSRRIKALSEVQVLAQRAERVTSLKIDVQLNSTIGQLETLLDEAIRLQSSIKFMGQAALLQKRVADLKAAQTDAETKLAEKTEELRREQVLQHICPRCGKPLEHVCNG